MSKAVCSSGHAAGPLGERLGHSGGEPGGLLRHHDVGHPAAQHPPNDIASSLIPGLR